MSADERPISRGAKALAVALALLAPARMAWIVFKYGENNLSNDYIGRVQTVFSILDGRYDFRNLFSDTFIGSGHSWLAILPIYLFDARFFAWSMNVELGIGLLLAAAKTLLIWLAVAPSLSARMRWLLLPVLSALAFSFSQVTSFTFGESTLQMQLPQLGLALGAYALARFGQRPNLRCALIAAGGVLASWSWGGGVMVWPVFFAAVFALGERDLRRWCVLGLAAATGLSQYAWHAAFHHTLTAIERPGLSQPFRYVGLLGRPFANGTAFVVAPLRSALVFGAVGLLLAGGALAVERHRWRTRIPALTILGWSLLVALEIGFFRSDAAPWYITPMLAFWAGLAILLASAPRPLAIAGFATIAAGLLYSNRTWEDKCFYLPSRAPGSAACLREWRTAPASCRARLFQWGGPDKGEPAALGEVLEQHGLSVFGPRRTYLLQGDVAALRVWLDPESAPSFLSRDGRTRGDPNDFRRLDLVLAPGSTVSWRVDLPANLQSAQLLTRVHAAAPGDDRLAQSARVSISTDGSSVLFEERSLLPRQAARALSVDLSSLAGKTIMLRFTADETHEGASALVFEVPRVLMTLDPERRTFLLQGDVAVGRARLAPESAASFFSADGRTPGEIDGLRRLDLVLAPGSTVSWRVDLPPGTRTARFRSVVQTDPDEALDSRGVAVSASAGPDSPTVASRMRIRRGDKRELVLDLSRFSGRTVNLELRAEETRTPGAPLRWEAPRIDLALEGTK